MPELVLPEETPVEAQLFPTLPKERCVVQDFTLETTSMSLEDRQRVETWVDAWMERPQRAPIMQMGKAMKDMPVVTFKEATEKLEQGGMNIYMHS